MNGGDWIKRSWTQQKGANLINLVEQHGPRNWSMISSGIPGRSGKSCRLCWCNQLSPSVHHRPFTPHEDAIIIQAHSFHGNKWATIARLLPKRRNHHLDSISSESNSVKPNSFEQSESNNAEDDNNDSSDEDEKRPNKRSCLHVRTTSAIEEKRFIGPETSLTLSPPGGGSLVISEAKVVKKYIKEREGTCVLNIIQRMIAQEVKSFFDKLTENNGHYFGPAFGLELEKISRNSQ
ncbi:transcription factor MYB77-like [Rutidosis leptorrhynchoides]|uniref:transcription factor MYB77-like n=1 Tax=Rutidosis leptorrhynchoides TaxID=125765 RepID=UPI003A99DFC4